MRRNILLSYLFMATGLLFGACTVSLEPEITPTPTQTEAPPTSAPTTTLMLTVTTTPIAAPDGVTLTTPSTAVAITLTEAVTEATTLTETGVTTITAGADPGITPTAPLTDTSAMTGTGVTTTTPAASPSLTQTGAITGTLFQVISATPNLQTLASVLTAAGMAEALELPGPFTIFAPTDEAFTTLPPDQEEALLNDPAALAAVLQYHVVVDEVTAEELTRLGAALASSGQPIIITLQTDGSLLVNTARIVQADIIATNGIIHQIDGVLLPPAP